MNKRLPIFLGFLLVILALWLLITPVKFIRSLISNLDNLGYDLQLKTHVLTGHHAPLSPVAIIDIDDKSIHAEGHWPWPRAKIAALVDELQQQGAAVLAFDIFFSENQANIDEVLMNTLRKKNLLSAVVAESLTKHLDLFDEDKQLASSLKKIQSVLAISFLPRAQTSNLLPTPLLTLTTNEQQFLALIHASGYISNIPVLQEAAFGSGFINVFADSDGIIRHAPLLMVYQGKVYPSLALQAVLLLLNEKISLVAPLYGKHPKLEGIRLGERILPTDGSGQVLIPFIGKSYTFPFYSATDVLHGRLPEDALFGKILFIGTSATGLGDLHPTAIANPFPGVEIQASLANGILQNNFSYKPEWTMGATLFFSGLFGIIAAILFPYLGPRILGLLILLFPPIVLFVNNWIWQTYGLVLSFLVPILLILSIAILNIIYGYLFETRRREHLKSIFGQYVPEKHIDEMLKVKSNFALHGENREMSVLFADIRSFTTISEGLTASNLVEMLNTFFTPMTEIIFNHKGTIDKYVGDLIMAFWGAPLKDKHHARNAIESALEMQEKVKAMHEVLAQNNWPDIHIGIGINSGMMCVGDMGSRYRRNYTVLGDSVNLASRIESLTKYYGVDVMVSENTQQNQPKYIFRRLDYVRVKGKKTGVGIYEVVCRKKELSAELAAELTQYHQALDFYLKQQWGEAHLIMEKLHNQYPERKIYSLYIDRIAKLKTQPLPIDWDGVYTHESK